MKITKVNYTFIKQALSIFSFLLLATEYDGQGYGYAKEKGNETHLGKKYSWTECPYRCNAGHAITKRLVTAIQNMST